MKFDSSLAWRQASSAVSANRDVLIALVGVFVLLPNLAFSLFFPQPEPKPGMNQEQMLALMSQYYMSALPFLIPVTLAQAGGTLSILSLFTDRARPTVGEAIRSGFTGLLPYIAAQILLGMGIGLAVIVLSAIGSLTGSPALAVVFILIALTIAFWSVVRSSLVAPIVIVERQRNPVAALLRSFALTQGNAGRLAAFYVLVGLAFIVVLILLMGLVGVVLALVASGTVARVAAAVCSSALGSVMTLYFVAIVAAAHRQLAASAVPSRLD